MYITKEITNENQKIKINCESTGSKHVGYLWYFDCKQCVRQKCDTDEGVPLSCINYMPADDEKDKTGNKRYCINYQR